MKKISFISSLVLITLTSITFSQKPMLEDSPIDKIQFWDVNNNYFVVHPNKISYSPISKELSSSGNYNGGKPTSNKIHIEDFNQLSKDVKRIYDTKGIRSEKRNKGTVKLQLENENGIVEFIFIKAGNESTKLRKLIKRKLN